jgi:hypothetical protein
MDEILFCIDNFDKFNMYPSSQFTTLSDKHLKIYAEYYNKMYKEKEDKNVYPCSFCYLPCLEKDITCNSCCNKYHKNCFDKPICNYCYYYSEDGYKLNIIYNKKLKEDKCLHCKLDSFTPICEICYLKFKGKSVIPDILKSTLKQHQYKNDDHYSSTYKIFKESFDIATNFDNTEQIETNFYLNDYVKNLNNAKLVPYLLTPNKITLKNIVKFKYPPVAIANHIVLGLAAYATEDIEENTLLCEYVGEVMLESDVDGEDDYSMRILDVGLYQRNLVVSPIKKSNFAKYLSGFNKEEHCNVSSKTMNVNGLAGVYLFTKLKVKQREVLYYNYGWDDEKCKDFKLIKFIDDSINIH